MVRYSTVTHQLPVSHLGLSEGLVSPMMSGATFAVHIGRGAVCAGRIGCSPQRRPQPLNLGAKPVNVLLSAVVASYEHRVDWINLVRHNNNYVCQIVNWAVFAESSPHTSQPSRCRRENSSTYGPGLTVSTKSIKTSGFTE